MSYIISFSIARTWRMSFEKSFLIVCQHHRNCYCEKCLPWSKGLRWALIHQSLPDIHSYILYFNHQYYCYWSSTCTSVDDNGRPISDGNGYLFDKYRLQFIFPSILLQINEYKYEKFKLNRT